MALLLFLSVNLQVVAETGATLSFQLPSGTGQPHIFQEFRLFKLHITAEARTAPITLTNQLPETAFAPS